MDDHKLLRGYVRNRSQEAFQELVDRHLGMVYSAARRMVHDPHLAEEVTQATFRTLAQKARSLRPPQVVAGWLYNTARQVAEHTRASAKHGQGHEAPTTAKGATSTGVPSILEHLDEAMGEIDLHARDALVLRYLENRSLREVELELGLTEDAARTKINRALEHLREELSHEGFPVTLVLLTTTLSSNLTVAYPPGFGADVTLAALNAAVAPAATAAEQHSQEWKLIGAMVGTALLVGAATYFIQQRHIERLHSDNQNLLTQQQKLSADREAALSAVRERETEVALLRKENEELGKLKAEAGQFLQQRQALLSLQKENKKIRDQLAQPATSTNKVANLISKENLAFVGYDTPEAAIETATWALITGNYEEMIAASSPEIQAAELSNAKSREEFETGRQKVEPMFSGLSLLAKKMLSDDEVEIKVQWNYFDASGKQTDRHLLIQPLIRVDGPPGSPPVWKIKPTHNYDSDWENGQILTFSP